MLLRPESRGRVELASSDPKVPVRIHQNFLAIDKDWATLRAGIRLVARHRPGGALGPVRREGDRPRAAIATPTPSSTRYIRATAITVHHPLGTCRMGRPADPTAVVDPELRVLGVDGLRVVDASVMPDLVGGNINAVVIMIAEKAADLIRGRPPLAPVNV